MLPSDLMEYGEHCIRISEVTDVLQHDLLLPLTKVDQRVSLSLPKLCFYHPKIQLLFISYLSSIMAMNKV